MNKEQLFGMCLGWFVKYTDPLNNENSETGTLTSVFGKDVEIEYEDDGGLVEIQLTSFCQLIARRISSMTEERLREHQLNPDPFDAVEKALEEGYLDDKYFDNGWAVEARNE